MDQMMMAPAIIALNVRKCFANERKSIQGKGKCSKLMDTHTKRNRTNCKRIASSFGANEEQKCISSDNIEVELRLS